LETADDEEDEEEEDDEIEADIFAGLVSDRR
jgi:hypothetical protein